MILNVEFAILMILVPIFAIIISLVLIISIAKIDFKIQEIEDRMNIKFTYIKRKA